MGVAEVILLCDKAICRSELADAEVNEVRSPLTAVVCHDDDDVYSLAEPLTFVDLIKSRRSRQPIDVNSREASTLPSAKWLINQFMDEMIIPPPFPVPRQSPAVRQELAFFH